ncbi:MAG: DUF4012 domain-containing protein [Candidatus Kerfeldbacteria bacterium]|nr:DUF4012 domain-containing protein [Candidatus Kerfeldbacteria bacterium]
MTNKKSKKEHIENIHIAQNGKQRLTPRKHMDGTVPKDNILDLRSLVAKREAAQSQHRRHAPRVQGTRTASPERRVRTQVPKKEKKETTISPTVSPRTKKKKTPRKRRRFFERPLEDAELNRLRASELPLLGLSFSAVGKPLVVFLFLALLCILPAGAFAMLAHAERMQNQLSQSAQEAFTHLQTAAQDMKELNFIDAQKEFDTAHTQLSDIRTRIDDINVVARTIAPYLPGPGQKFASGQHLIVAAQALSNSGAQIAKTLDLLSTADWKTQLSDTNTGLTSILVAAHSGFSPALDGIQEANTALGRVSLKAVPEDKRALVAAAQQFLPRAEQQLQDALAANELLLSFLGNDESKRYLVLFANNHELRPTGGGFPGSFGIFDISKGVVTQAEIPGGGIYDVAGQLQEKLISPEPLHVVNPLWNIQDALWFPHYPTSAQKVEWFLEHTNDPVSVDGVISLTPTVVEKLLALTGPIDMTTDYGQIITAENFYSIVQTEAEKKFDETRESKRIIADMTPALFEKVFAAAQDPKQMMNMLRVFQTALNQKDILVWVNDSEIEQLFSQRNWSGELMSTDRDYLHINVANIGGGKTSQVVEHSAHLDTVVNESGKITNTVTLTAVHKGSETDPFENTNHISFVRFYIPKGSTLISATGFETPDSKLFLTPDSDAVLDKDLLAVSGDISLNPLTGVYTNTEFDKDVVAGWMQTPLNDSSTVVIQYTLPFSISLGRFWHHTDQYSLLVQKQPGINMLFSSTLNLPDDMRIDRSYPEDYTGKNTTLLEEDLFTGVILERSH